METTVGLLGRVPVDEDGRGVALSGQVVDRVTGH